MKDSTKEAISRGRKGKGLGPKSEKTKRAMMLARQRRYLLTSPMGTDITVVSNALKVFCSSMGMSYSSLMRAKALGKVYRGWTIVEIT